MVKIFLKTLLNDFLESCSIVHSHQQHMMAASFLTSSVTLAIISNFCLSFPKRRTIVSLDGVSLLVSWWAIDVDIFPCGYSHDIHLLYILTFCIYSSVNCMLKTFAQFLFGLFVFCLSSFESSLYNIFHLQVLFA